MLHQNSDFGELSPSGLSSERAKDSASRSFCRICPSPPSFSSRWALASFSSLSIIVTMGCFGSKEKKPAAKKPDTAPATTTPTTAKPDEKKTPQAPKKKELGGDSFENIDEHYILGEELGTNADLSLSAENLSFYLISSFPPNLSSPIFVFI